MNIEWSSKTPAINSPGLRLSLVTTGHDNRKSKNVTVHGLAAFPDNGQTLEKQIRSIFLTITHENGTALFHNTLFMNQVVFPDDIKTQLLKESDIVKLIPFDFNLQEETKINLVAGRIYIQLSAGMFQSPVESVEIP